VPSAPEGWEQVVAAGIFLGQLQIWEALTALQKKYNAGLSAQTFTSKRIYYMALDVPCRLHPDSPTNMHKKAVRRHWK